MTQAQANLKKQKYRLAAIALRRLLNKSPDAEGLQVMLGHALAGLHRCDEGLDLMLAHPERRAFTVDVARLSATCLIRRGDVGQAVYWMEQAAALQPGSLEVRAGLAVLLGGFYEVERAAALFEGMEEDAINNQVVQMSWALFALSMGDVDQVEARLRAHDAIRGRPYPMRFFVEGRLEMDLGNPIAADVFFQKTTSRLQAYFPAINMSAESIRRQGNPIGALDALDTNGAIQNTALRAQNTRAIRARILVDLGRLAEAEAQIDDALAVNSLDVTARASAWYLARARGDAAAMAEQASLYQTLQASPLRDLEKLVPLGQLEP
jgi:tetratricopeptide (TPR) repeat protein